MVWLLSEQSFHYDSLSNFTISRAARWQVVDEAKYSKIRDKRKKMDSVRHRCAQHRQQIIFLPVPFLSRNTTPAISEERSRRFCCAQRLPC